MHYLIDLDNTLLKTFYLDRSGHVRFYWARAFQADTGQSEAVLGELFQGAFLDALRKTRDLAPFIEPWLQKYHLPFSAASFLEYWLSHDMIVCPPVWRWITEQKHKGHHLHIASNQPHVRMDYLWEHYPAWHTLFDHVFTSARLGVAKPDSAFFERVCTLLGTRGDDVCLIDDEYPNIRAARAFGLTAILYRTPADLP